MRDEFFQFTLVGQIISAVRESKKIDEQYRKDHDELHKLADFSNYFNVETEKGSNATMINLADGRSSWNGGSIVFTLREDGHADLEMEVSTFSAASIVLSFYRSLLFAALMYVYYD